MADKQRAATVRLMFKLPPGYPPPELKDWIAFVERAMKDFQSFSHLGELNAVCSYADVEVIDAMIIPPEKG